MPDAVAEPQVALLPEDQSVQFAVEVAPASVPSVLVPVYAFVLPGAPAVSVRFKGDIRVPENKPA